MPLDPQVLKLREARMASNTRPLYEMSVAEARAADLAAIRAESAAREHVASVIERTIPGPGPDIPIRVYHPRPGEQLPVLVYFFGGGWVLGTLDTADAVCRFIANAVPCVVVVVGYRLAPEHKFPAAVEDCFAATQWVAHNAASLGGDPRRVAVGGDSAGGNLAAVVALLSRDQGAPPLVFQLLVYPNTDHTAENDSRRDNTDPAFFNRRSADWYRSHYLPDQAAADDPLASPLKAEDLSGLPPALVISAEYDPLRDECEAYVHRLEQSGVDVALSRYDGVVHGFFTMTGVLDAARRAQQEAADACRRAFAR